MPEHPRVVVDTRWHGDFGIGRHSKEVISRLTIPNSTSYTRGHPLATLDPLRLRRHLRQIRPDLYYTPGFNAAFGSGCQLLTVHDLLPLQVDSPSLSHRLYFERVIRPAIVRMGTVMTVSRTSQAALAQWLDTPSVEIINIGSACSATFQTDGPIKQLDRPYLMYVGNLKEHKRSHIVLQIAAEFPDLDLVMVTADLQGARMLGLRHRLGERLKVFTGLSDETLAEYYRGAEALLMPSEREGFGLPALESLCSGTPVVYWTGCNSIHEFADDFGGGVSDAGDMDEWVSVTQKVAGVAVDPDDHALREQYSWDAVADRVAHTIGALVPA